MKEEFLTEISLDEVYENIAARIHSLYSGGVSEERYKESIEWITEYQKLVGYKMNGADLALLETAAKIAAGINPSLPDKTPRDWIEDSEHENGNYVCMCCICKMPFYGHKRRVVCKICDKI